MSEDGSGLYIVPSDSEAPLLLERLAKEGQRREVERLENAKERLRQRRADELETSKGPST